jgi:glutamate synthase (NADPH/NADH) large chain
MVDLEPVLEEEDVIARHYHQTGDLGGHGRVDIMADMSRFDAERLHQLVANHAAYTGSQRARHILDNWNACLTKFRKVMPVEYRRALAELKAREGHEPRLVAAGA